MQAFRVGADGTPLDSMATLLLDGGSRARVASSGSEFVVTADRRGEIVTSVLHADESALRTEAAKTLAASKSETASAITWGGISYVGAGGTADRRFSPRRA